MTEPNASAITIETALAETKLVGGYLAATQKEMDRSEDAFARLIKGERSANLENTFKRIGFVLGPVTISGKAHMLVREAPDRLEGKGVYVVRQEGCPVLLQAPHRFKDLDTGDIAALLMQHQLFRAVAWNTAPRWYDEEGLRVDADLAHIAISHFNAFGKAFARAAPSGRVVQIHGFERTKRTTIEGQSASAIVSAGINTPSTAARNLCTNLALEFVDETSLLYPEQAKELGGTTNENGKALREIGFGGFVHIELSREFRTRLLSEVDTSARFAACVKRG